MATVVLSYADINALVKADGVTVQPAADGAVTVTGSVVVAGHRFKGSGVGSLAATRTGIKVTISDLKSSGLTAAVTALLRTRSCRSSSPTAACRTGSRCVRCVGRPQPA